MSPSRRQFLRQSGLSGVGLLTFSIAGCDKEVTPAQARRQNATLKLLSSDEYRGLEVLCDRIVPGSMEAGVSSYVDHQLSADPVESMLMIRYLGVNTPYAPFYQGGLAAADAVARARFGVPLASAGGDEAQTLVDAMASGEVEGWEGPPPGFFFFIIRADAVDVRYGTQDGFASLGIPYQPHILPPSRWGDG